MGQWTNYLGSRIEQKFALSVAWELAKGSYQKNIVRGVDSLSGSTLTGKARQYGGTYAASRSSLLQRLAADERLTVGEERGERGARILAIGLTDKGRRLAYEASVALSYEQWAAWSEMSSARIGERGVL